MPVALSGRVPVKIASSSEPIYPGDYITTSDIPGKGTKAIKAGAVIGKALEFWTPESGVATVMVYVEQGYYENGVTEKTFGGLTFFNADVSFMSQVTFGAQVEFTVPPLFNADTAGFAVIKSGAKKVDVTFDTPYIATPVVNTSVSFEEGDNVTESNVDQFFANDVKFVIINKSKNGFTIILNKNATDDIRFSWTALQVKDAKVFESVIPGLVIENPTTPQPTDTTSNPEPEPSTESDTTPSSEVTTEPTPEPEPIVEPIPEPIIEPTPEPVVEPAPVQENPPADTQAPSTESPAI